MSGPAPIEIPFEGVDDGATALLDKLATGFDALVGAGERAAQTLGAVGGAADSLRGQLEALATGFDGMAAQVERIAGGADALRTALGGIDLAGHAGQVQALTGAYVDLGAAIELARGAGAGGIPSPAGGAPGVPGGAAPAGGGTSETRLQAQIMDPTGVYRTSGGTIGTLNTGDAAIARAQTLIDQHPALYNPDPNAPNPLNTVPEPIPADPARGDVARGGILESARNLLVYGAGYQLGYGAVSGIGQSIGRSAQYSRTQGSTQANTGLTGDQMAELAALTTGLAGSGGMPYDQNTLLQGEYSLASLGIGQNTADPARSVFDVGQVAARMSAASGAPDTGNATDAITSVLADYRLNNRNVVANAQRVADQLQVGAKLGKAELPAFAAQIATPATQASQLGIDSGQVIGYLAAESAGGLSTGELGQDMYSMLRSSVHTTRPQREVADALGIQYDSSFWGKYGVAGGAQLIQQREEAQGLTRDQMETVDMRLFGNEAASKGLASAQAGGLYDFQPQVEGSRGAVTAAYTTSQSYAGAKMQDAETQLATAFDGLTKTTLPALTLAIQGAATVLADVPTIIDNWGKKTPENPQGATVLDTAKEIVLGLRSPFGGDAQNQAATQPDNNMWNDKLGGWIDQHVPGGKATVLSMSNPITAAGAAAYGIYNHAGGDIPGVTGGTGVAHASGDREIYGYGHLRPAPVGLPPPIAPAQVGGDQEIYGYGHLPQAQAGAAGADGYTYSGARGDHSAAYQAAMTTGQSARTPDQIASAADLKALHDSLTGQVKELQDLFRADLARKDFAGAGQAAGSLQALESANAGVLQMDPFGIDAGAASMRAQVDAGQKAQLDRQIKDIQDQAAIDQLSGDTGAQTRDQARLLGIQAANATTLGLDPQDLKLLGAQGAQDARRTQLDRQLKDLQDAISVDQLGGDAGAQKRDQGRLLALQTANAGILQLDPADLALLRAQDRRANAVAAPGETLIRPQQVDPGSALAGYMGGVAQLSRGPQANPAEEMVRHLEEQVRMQQQTIRRQDDQIRLLERQNTLTAAGNGLLHEIAHPTGAPDAPRPAPPPRRTAGLR